MRYLSIIFFSFITSQLFSQNEVIYIWSGAITYNSAKVNAKMSDASTAIRLMADDDSTFTTPLYSPYYTVDSTTNLMAAMEITGLSPLTKYFYAVESAGIADTSADDVGSFKTFANGPFSYSFVLGSCAYRSDHKVFDAMKNMSPSFYMNMGDLHYDNPGSDVNINVHRLPYENSVLSKSNTAALFKKVPFVYMWDDHDYCGNNTDSTAVGKENARKAYHEYVPHYPMGLGTGPNFPICQSFTIGRVHFIMTDLRSERYPADIMGAAQKTWFENECIYARDNNLIVAWMNTYSWSGTDYDNWLGFSMERTEINDFFYCNLIANLFILSGDAHMLAIDNGTNANFSSNSCEYFLYPIFQVAALNQGGSYKGGVYSEGGYFMNPDLYTGQFGLVDVQDMGTDSICISFKGYRVDSSGTNVTQINSYNFCRYLPVISVNEKTLLNNVIVQPNPSNAFSLVFKDKTLLKSLKVYSALGAMVYSEKINAFTSTYSPLLPQLKTACYIIEIETDKHIIRKYWIKK